MKYIKTFENHKEEWRPKLEIGDYVVLNPDTFDNNFNNFIKNKIGTVISMYIENSQTAVRVKYDNVPLEFKYMFLRDSDEIIFTLNNVKYFSKNKKDLEYILSEDKYNL